METRVPPPLGHAGSLFLPLGLALSLTALCGLGWLGLLRQWRKQVETQIRLDRCVGGVAFEFQGLLESITAGNVRIQTLRASLAAASLAPPARLALQAALHAQVLAQEAGLIRWNLRRAQWILRPCGAAGDQADLLPETRYARLPPDAVGEQVLRWVGVEPRSFRFQIGHHPRRAAAEIQRRKNDLVPAIWTARWVAPRPGLP